MPKRARAQSERGWPQSLLPTSESWKCTGPKEMAAVHLWRGLSSCCGWGGEADGLELELMAGITGDGVRTVQKSDSRTHSGCWPDT